MAAPLRYRVTRAAYNQDEFDTIYEYGKPKWSIKNIIKERWHEIRKKKLSTFAKEWLPFLDWMFTYKLSYMVNDIVSGITVAIFSVPQAMAYASQAAVPPIIGLYSSFFPTILFALLGTSKHVSQGMFAVVSLMVGLVTQRYDDGANSTMNDALTADDLGNLKSVQVTTAITFTVGIVFAVMSILQLHFIAAYMSDPLVGGFTTGCAFHVFASQLPKLFGLSIPSHSGIFKLFYILKDLILVIDETNIPDLIVSIVCIVFLHVGKWYINPFVKKRIPIPIPFELIAVIVATLLSYFLDFENKYHMSIVSNIPTGIPTPRAPEFKLIPDLAVDSVVIAIVIFAINISLGKLFAKKHGYRINGPQDLRALTVVELVTSFFLCHPASGSLSRAAVCSQCQASTQVSSIISAVLILLVILWAGPLLEPLPKCILSSIIVVALQGMFLQAKETRTLWKSSRVDFAIWIVSFLGTFLWDVSQGLGVAIGFALITVIFRSQWPKSVQLVRVGDTELYRDVQRYKVHSVMPNILIYRFDAPLLFFNSENFKEKVLEMVEKHEKELQYVSHTQLSDNLKNNGERNGIKYVVIDASGFIHVDQMGVISIKELGSELGQRKIEMLISSCKAQVRELCQTCGVYGSVPKRCFFPSIHDAVLYALQKESFRSSKSSLEEETEEEELDEKF